MTPTDLIQRLRDHEDNFVERKPQSVSGSEIRQTASAFANQLSTLETGILFVGVSNDGNLLGVDNTDSLQKRVRKACHQDCHPPVKYTAQVLESGGKHLVAVVIPASDDKPHFTGPAYLRIGSESVKANDEQFKALIASQNDKCRSLQRIGNGVISVTSYKYLGSTKRVSDGAFRQCAECRILDVDAHTIRLENIGNNQRYTEPLDNVTISYDEDKHRDALIVRDYSARS